MVYSASLVYPRIEIEFYAPTWYLLLFLCIRFQLSPHTHKSAAFGHVRISSYQTRTLKICCSFHLKAQQKVFTFIIFIS